MELNKHTVKWLHGKLLVIYVLERGVREEGGEQIKSQQINKGWATLVPDRHLDPTERRTALILEPSAGQLAGRMGYRHIKAALKTS